MKADMITSELIAIVIGAMVGAAIEYYARKKIKKMIG